MHKLDEKYQSRNSFSQSLLRRLTTRRSDFDQTHKPGYHKGESKPRLSSINVMKLLRKNHTTH